MKTTLVKIDGYWINPAHVACLAPVEPWQGLEDKTIVQLAGTPGLPCLSVKASPDEVAAILLKAVEDANPTFETRVVNSRMYVPTAETIAALKGLASHSPQP